MQAPPGSPSSQAGAAWQYHAAAVPLRVLLGSVCTAPGLHACAATCAARSSSSCATAMCVHACRHAWHIVKTHLSVFAGVLLCPTAVRLHGVLATASGRCSSMRAEVVLTPEPLPFANEEAPLEAPADESQADVLGGTLPAAALGLSAAAPGEQGAPMSLVHLRSIQEMQVATRASPS
jgi:hypothetical protein